VNWGHFVCLWWFICCVCCVFCWLLQYWSLKGLHGLLCVKWNCRMYSSTHSLLGLVENQEFTEAINFSICHKFVRLSCFPWFSPNADFFCVKILEFLLLNYNLDLKRPQLPSFGALNLVTCWLPWQWNHMQGVWHN